MSNLKKVIKVTEAQFNTLVSGGTVGGSAYTDDALYAVEHDFQSDWNVEDYTKDAFIKNKPTDLVQDVDYVHTDNNYSDEDKDKLDDIEDGAQVNVLEHIKFNDINLPISAKSINVKVLTDYADTYGEYSDDNPLTTRQFVNSSIENMAANFRGNWDSWSNVPSASNVNQYPADATGNHVPQYNDYMIVNDANSYAEIPVIEIGKQMQKETPSSSIWQKVDAPISDNKKHCMLTYGPLKFDDSSSYSFSFNNESEITTILILRNNTFIANTNPGTYSFSGTAQDGDILYINVNFGSTLSDERIIDYKGKFQNFIINGSNVTSLISKGYNGSWRFRYTHINEEASEFDKLYWVPNYKVGSTLTAAQQAALDSTITVDKVNDMIINQHNPDVVFGTDANGVKHEYPIDSSVGTTTLECVPLCKRVDAEESGAVTYRAIKNFVTIDSIEYEARKSAGTLVSGTIYFVI